MTDSKDENLTPKNQVNNNLEVPTETLNRKERRAVTGGAKDNKMQKHGNNVRIKAFTPKSSDKRGVVKRYF